mmetsp:Transcript_57510/g.85626  ORF Transcript_57510/g.85626 Transcript_57510/m.85626 type:complete len:251 (+) Transcript_57510:162-914(+)
MTLSQLIFPSIYLVLLLSSTIILKEVSAFSVRIQSVRKSSALEAVPGKDNGDLMATSRRSVLNAMLFAPVPVYAKCTDIESCREIGEKKVEQDLIDNPVTKLDSGARYKVLQPGTGQQTVGKESNVDLIFSVSTMSGGYMYSRGFGYEKVDIGNGKMVKDAGLDSIRVKIGGRDVPIGIEDALIGMKKGERRRVELPPQVGLITSNWQPEPTTRQGIAGLKGYRRIIEGTTGTPPFPAALIWDIEVLKIR